MDIFEVYEISRLPAVTQETFEHYRGLDTRAELSSAIDFCWKRMEKSDPHLHELIELFVDSPFTDAAYRATDGIILTYMMNARSGFSLHVSK